jgi:hypothetical protein
MADAVENRFASDDLVEDSEGSEAQRRIGGRARMGGHGNDCDERGQEQK